jgi:hypothetical protein
MSFSIEFKARSRSHALRVLEQRAASLPTSVLNAIKISLEHSPAPQDHQRAFIVEAHGHLCDGPSSSPHTSFTVKVTPIDIPD